MVVANIVVPVYFLNMRPRTPRSPSLTAPRTGALPLIQPDILLSPRPRMMTPMMVPIPLPDDSANNMEITSLCGRWCEWASLPGKSSLQFQSRSTAFLLLHFRYVPLRLVITSMPGVLDVAVSRKQHRRQLVTAVRQLILQLGLDVAENLSQRQTRQHSLNSFLDGLH